MAFDFRTLPRCEARARSTKQRCKQPVMRNPRTGQATKCYWHGGACTGPSPEGRKRLAALNTKHGRYSKAALEAKKHLRTQLKALEHESEGLK